MLAFVAAAVAAATTAAAADFPVLWDIGAASSLDVPSLVKATPRVQLGMIKECPHPCGLLPTLGCDPKTAEYGCNGALPQGPGFNLTLHLDTLQRTFDGCAAGDPAKRKPCHPTKKNIPDDDDRLLDLDFESWGPLWDHANAGYQNASIALVQKVHPSWSQAQVLAEATKDWEAAASSLLITTIRFVKKIRPKLKVALYMYPLREYYNGYNSSSAPALRADNDRMMAMGLFCEVDALFPSVCEYTHKYLSLLLSSTQNNSDRPCAGLSADQFYDSVGKPATEKANQEYVLANVQEAVRLAKEIPSKCPGKIVLPVWVYTWLRYHAVGTPLIADQDARMYWEQSWAAGATGLVLWGDESTPAHAAEFGPWWKSKFTPLLNSWSPPTVA
jgi:hypothetical protein